LQAAPAVPQTGTVPTWLVPIDGPSVGWRLEAALLIAFQFVFILLHPLDRAPINKPDEAKKWQAERAKYGETKKAVAPQK
jgi:hypothetical protein